MEWGPRAPPPSPGQWSDHSSQAGSVTLSCCCCLHWWWWSLSWCLWCWAPRCCPVSENLSAPCLSWSLPALLWEKYFWKQRYKIFSVTGVMSTVWQFHPVFAPQLPIFRLCCFVCFDFALNCESAHSALYYTFHYQTNDFFTNTSIELTDSTIQSSFFSIFSKSFSFISMLLLT